MEHIYPVCSHAELHAAKELLSYSNVLSINMFVYTCIYYLHARGIATRSVAIDHFSICRKRLGIVGSAVHVAVILSAIVYTLYVFYALSIRDTFD